MSQLTPRYNAVVTSVPLIYGTTSHRSHQGQKSLTILLAAEIADINQFSNRDAAERKVNTFDKRLWPTVMSRVYIDVGVKSTESQSFAFSQSLIEMITSRYIGTLKITFHDSRLKVFLQFNRTKPFIASQKIIWRKLMIDNANSNEALSALWFADFY